MQYETLYWSMACIVAIALLGGALCARAATLSRTLLRTLTLSGIVGGMAYVLARGGEFGEHAPILGIASLMFCMMISTAAALVTRKALGR